MNHKDFLAELNRILVKTAVVAKIRPNWGDPIVEAKVGRGETAVFILPKDIDDEFLVSVAVIVLCERNRRGLWSVHREDRAVVYHPNVARYGRRFFDPSKHITPPFLMSEEEIRDYVEMRRGKSS